MKIVAMSFLLLGVVCSSTLAIAQSPVPFNLLMQNAGSQPVASNPDTQGNSNIAAAQPSHPHMTRGGKIELGIGVGLLGLGVIFIGAGAAVRNGDWFAGETRAIGFGGGAVFAGMGGTLIVLGAHRRSSK